MFVPRRVINIVFLGDAGVGDLLQPRRAGRVQSHSGPGRAWHRSSSCCNKISHKMTKWPCKDQVPQLHLVNTSVFFFHFLSSWLLMSEEAKMKPFHCDGFSAPGWFGALGGTTWAPPGYPSPSSAAPSVFWSYLFEGITIKNTKTNTIGEP